MNARSLNRRTGESEEDVPLPPSELIDITSPKTDDKGPLSSKSITASPKVFSQHGGRYKLRQLASLKFNATTTGNMAGLISPVSVDNTVATNTSTISVTIDEDAVYDRDDEKAHAPSSQSRSTHSQSNSQQKDPASKSQSESTTAPEFVPDQPTNQLASSVYFELDDFSF